MLLVIRRNESTDVSNTKCEYKKGEKKRSYRNLDCICSTDYK